MMLFKPFGGLFD